MPPFPKGDLWAAGLGAYFAAMVAANRSPGTIRLHRFYLSKLREAHPRPWDVNLLDLQTLIGNPSWKGDAKKSARTVYRGFYKWGHGMGYVDHDCAFALPAVTVPEGVPRPTPQLIAKRVMRDPDARIAFMALLAGKLGMRAGEIAVLHSDDLNGDLLLIHGKGRKERVVPVVDPLLFGLLQRVDGYAFPGRIDGHLSPGTVSRYVSTALGPGWTAHTLRHRALTEAYKGTKDLLAVGKMAGHARSETTQRYVQIDADALRAALTAAAVA